MKSYVTYILRAWHEAVTGSAGYRIWLLCVGLVMVFGLSAYYEQITGGLAVTGMTDQVSWGLYIANFTFLVGVAAAAVMLVIPAYVYGKKEVREIVLIGELLAIVAVIMCLAFVTVDLGRPDRMWHMIPGIGKFHWPVSMLSWDVVVLSVYLILNMHIPGYLLYRRYQNREPSTKYYIPFIFLSIVWAISIHTVTAFLYVGLAGRPFWNTAIIAPRFLASAFAAGPGLIYIVLQFLRTKKLFPVPDGALVKLKQIFTVALLINVFLMIAEVFTEFYTDSLHVASARYLWLGLHGHNALVPWIWTGTILNLTAATILVVPRWNRQTRLVIIACAMAIVGIWIEKGPGLIIPGFIPTPLGEIFEYRPTFPEIRICIGIWALGTLLYSMLLKMALAIETGRLREKGSESPNAPGSPSRLDAATDIG